jgi:putative addiction module component (TIGR02574 family)
MSTLVRTVRDEALSLSLSERASLAHDLILSLDEPSDFDLGPEQEAEIARRVQMVREGTAKGRPAADVFHDIKAKFGK